MKYKDIFIIVALIVNIIILIIQLERQDTFEYELKKKVQDVENFVKYEYQMTKQLIFSNRVQTTRGIVTFEPHEGTTNKQEQ